VSLKVDMGFRERKKVPKKERESEREEGIVFPRWERR
jgi:hypothetical protein